MYDELRFNNAADLSEVVMDVLDENTSASVISDFNTIWDVAHWLYDEDENVEVNYVEIDTEDYDREYTLTIYEDDGRYYLDISKSYFECDDIYLAVEGIVFIDNKANSKILKDLKSMNVDFTPVFFDIGETENENECGFCNLETIQTDRKMIYSVPICLEGIINSFGKIIDEYFEEIFEK